MGPAGHVGDTSIVWAQPIGGSDRRMGGLGLQTQTLVGCLA